ncbi:hypothetical protein [Streptomyces bikiniensis]|uniref:hypothetical protein n=1 Tax=Streptomyces bikiniensis TaxID=1896 RepID=UPI00131A4CD7|nr:hypothetical protein [Streptomyces bikiniensis]
MIALALSETLNLNTSLAEEMDPWLHRLLRETVPLVHEVEKLVALLVACATRVGWTEHQVAYSMGRTSSNITRWKTQDAEAAAAAATEQELSDGWNVASAEAYMGAESSVEERDAVRRRAYRLMCLLLLHDTPSYAADSLTWVDDKTRRCIKNGWFLQARRAAGGTNAGSTPESTAQPKLPSQGKEAGAPKTESA